VSKTVDQVIEEHRIRIGAKRVHVSCAPNVTPDALEKALLHVEETDRIFNNIPETFKLQYEVDMLRRRLSEICKLSKTNINDFVTQSDEMSKLKSKLFELTDMVYVNKSDVIKAWEGVVCDY
jgi:hypothetical protein